MKITFGLNTKEIANAQKQLREYAAKVARLSGEVVETLVTDGVENAKELAQYMNAYDSGELVDGITGVSWGNQGKVAATAPHSAYVEFGTGVRGSEERHPEAFAHGWEYDVNEHGELGWWYYDADGNRRWTKGMPSRPFMYETAQLMRDAVPQTIERLLKDRK